MNYNNLFSNELPIYVSEKTGLKFYYRPNTSDIKTIMEVVERGVYEKKYFQIQADEHWIDLGGNIGAFTLLALSKGAIVDVYEADDEHCNLIKMNLELNGLNANVINKAVVHDDAKQVCLNIQKNGNTWRNSIIRNWNGGKKKVDCINIENVLNNNVCCKMDIEGAEMLILENLKTMPKKMVYEWSFDIDDNIDRYRNVLKKMIDNYENVKHNQIKDEHKIWKKGWFPPCRNVYCF